MQKVDHLMQQAVANSVFPGAVLLVSTDSGVIFHEAYGHADIFTQRPVTLDTVFDLASLTKPLATTLAVMILIQHHRIDLEQSLENLLPGFAGTEKSAVQVQHLLYHNSGLPDYRPYFMDLKTLPAARRKAALRDLLIQVPLVNPVGERVLYSDIGFMILAWIIEDIVGRGLSNIVADEIYKPLGIDNLFYAGGNRRKPTGGFAATELCPWRNRLLVGEVHDENAFVVGGIQGHAGLFGTATAVNQLLREMLCAYQGNPTHPLLQPDLVDLFLKRLPGTDRALGFDMPASRNSSAGRYFSRSSVGHLGFTGTSFWMDPERSIIVVLLTNRIHPTRNNEAIKAFRPKLHDEVMQYLV